MNLISYYAFEIVVSVNIVLIIFYLYFMSRGVLAEEKYTALFIFGDSSVDPGNNNYIETIPENQANYKPYGQKGFFIDPTGRFSDGRIIVDFLGPYGGIFTCGGTKKLSNYELCDDPNEYVWWDSFHPTQRIHEQFAIALWDGNPPAVGPYNLRGLFFPMQNQTIADLVHNDLGHDHLIF